MRASDPNSVDGHVVIVTGESHETATREAVPNIPIITEPVGRNTAAAIGLASQALAADDVLKTALEYAHDIARECSPTSCARPGPSSWS